MTTEPPREVPGTQSQLVGRTPTPSEAALIEFGKQTILKSVDTSLEFHKSMLEASATFGTLITTLVPILIWGNKDKLIPASEGAWLLLPPVLMLLSSIAFACGYFPRHREIQANVLEELRRARAQVLTTRARLAVVGMGLFCSSLISLIILVLALRP